MRIVHGFARCLVLSAVVASAGCAATRPQVTTDLETGLQVATSLEAVYAGLPSADPKVVAKLSLLLTVAQAAVGTFATSTNPTDGAAAEAAIAAALAYAASMGIKHQ